jgi:hypothetical protein
MLLGIGLLVLLVVAIGYAAWLYRQGSFPISRLRREAKRAARRARELDREDARFEPPTDKDLTN